MTIIVKLLLCWIVRGLAAPLGVGDLQRARTKVPRSPWRAAGAGAEMNALLNTHLQNRFSGATPCEQWSLADVQQFLTSLHPHLSSELAHIYEKSSDRRSSLSSLPAMPIADHQKQWAELEKSADAAGGLAKDVLRDAFCIEAALWLVHHTPSSALVEVPGNVPLLPEAPRSSADVPQSKDGAKVYKKYEETHYCTICHGTDTPFLPPGSDPAAPHWPPPVAPSMPYQFESDMDGWMIDRFIQPGGCNITTGSWHYDFIHNRIRLDYKAKPSKFPAKLWPLDAQIVMLWLGEGIPTDEQDVPLENIYGKGAQRGWTHMFIRPQPFLPWVCTKVRKPGLSILHPDIMSWGANFVGKYDVHPHVNVSFVAREMIENQWTDHYALNYVDVSIPNCTGPFELWKSINDNLPVADTGVVDCGRGNGRAYTHWSNFKFREPDLHLFTKTPTDYAKCKVDPGLDALERRLVAEWLESDDADVRKYAKEAASLAKASLHHTLGHVLHHRLEGDAQPAAQFTI